MTPPYTSTFPVQAPNFITMSTTGYINMVFTEINPTSTTTTILLVYQPDCCNQKVFTLGPYTVLRHDTTPSTPTPPVITPPPAQSAQPTQTAASATVTPISVGTSLSPAPFSPSTCESLLAAFLVVFWHFISVSLFSGRLATLLPVCCADGTSAVILASSTFQTVRSTQPLPNPITASATPTQPSSNHHPSATDLATILGAVFGSLFGGATLVVTVAMCWMEWKKHNTNQSIELT
ncbi:hypothetical protein AOQ84DRAFT_405903 [Glonium stellatum]|uniref:Uncharacterized protein n=1 Tax=Glonium stellatum TaxID=574774 RepID=A0A8E2FC37_9PEZI|nr:hypothetical protein AOQ84DRAFT_405903 [Glonium stellatum]